MSEIGKIYLEGILNANGQQIPDPEVTFKNNFRETTREEKIMILRSIIMELSSLMIFLEELPTEEAYDRFFKSFPVDSPKWRKQRGLR